MQILFILFFISLLGLIGMIGRKLEAMPNMPVSGKEYANPFLPDLEKLKLSLIGSAQRLAHAGLVTTLRLHIRFSNFLKHQYEVTKTKIKSFKKKDPNGLGEEKVEVSKFLKMVSDYKQKVREIKHKIKEEEIGM